MTYPKPDPEAIMDDRARPPAPDTNKPPRKPYAPPSVSLLGDLADLTLGQGGSHDDKGQGLPSKNGIG